MKVSHSTRTTILQLVDPACAAAQEHVETRIWNFNFLSVYSAKQVEELEKSIFSFGNCFNEIHIRAHRYHCDHTLRAT